MTTWDDMVPLLAPYVTTAPDMTLREALCASAADFLAQTYIWVESLDLGQLTAGSHTYPLVAPAVVEGVLWVVVAERELVHTHIREVPKSRLALEGKPQYFWLDNDESVRVWPTPETDEARFEVGVALKNGLTDTGIPSWIIETWGDAIVSGAVYRLARIPHKAWSDDKLALYHKMIFDRAKANARRREYRDISKHIKPRGFV